MDDSLQRDIAARMVRELAERGIDVVLVGSTAIVALELFSKSSKDADALGPPDLELDAARTVMRALASDLGLDYAELGWSTLAVRKLDEGGRERWRMDLLVPEGGPVPRAAAAIVHRDAVVTDVGRAAIPEHILVMKAVASGDSVGKGDRNRAEEYEEDLAELRRRLRTIRWDKVEELLRAYPDARAGPAARRINEEFGTRFAEPDDPSL